jgi:hypothetical protein
LSFWADKLNGQPITPTPVISRDLYPATYIPSAPAQQTVPATQSYTPTVRLVQGSTCPGCGSDRYRTNGSYAVACGECGYHPRFEQSGYGTPSLSSAHGSAIAARQIDSQGSSMHASIAELNAGGGVHL